MWASVSHINVHGEHGGSTGVLGVSGADVGKDDALSLCSSLPAPVQRGELSRTMCCMFISG